MASTTTPSGIPVTYTGNAEKYAACHDEIMKIPKVEKYIGTLVSGSDRNGITLEGISIDQIYWFCDPDPSKITQMSNLGFIIINAKMNRDGAFVPGIVFIRGNCVAVWIEVTVGEEVYILLVKQFRTPFGDTIVELPAGMIDSNDTFANALTKELKEECGISVSSTDIQWGPTIAPSIGGCSFSTTDIQWGPTIAPSIGGCDEQIKIGCVKVTMTPEEFASATKSVYGCEKEGERISLFFVNKNDMRDFMKSQPVLDGKIPAAAVAFLWS
jgi:8-oxo-dGTP pyrophosphatase MutT (NUDIX family)